MSIGMTLLVGLTILFALYTLYIFVSVAVKGCPHEEVRVGPEEKSATTATETPAPPQEAKVERAPEAEEAAPRIKQFRNPETGEVAAVPTHYRFAKRWIKEALVKEGLLDRIYRNNELQDEEIDHKVREALEKFKELKQYWA